MCYADTTTHDDGAATAFCCCGWSHDYAGNAAAERGAADHERTTAERDGVTD